VKATINQIEPSIVQGAQVYYEFPPPPPPLHNQFLRKVLQVLVNFIFTNFERIVSKLGMENTYLLA